MPNPREELTSIHQILHLTHHRNKNQHRLSKWYKSFSQLRRHVSKLILELDSLDTALKFSSSSTTANGNGKRGKGGEENKYVRAAREKVENRVRYMRVWGEGRWFLAFSNLVADNQYGTLGLVLLGMLARVRSVIGGLLEEDGGNEEVVVREENEMEALHKHGNAGVGEGDDFGEVVSREEVQGHDEDEEEGMDLSEEAQPAQDVGSEGVKEKTKWRKRKSLGEDPWKEREEREALAESAPSRPPKKKRKKGDAFDDLFDRLI